MLNKRVLKAGGVGRLSVFLAAGAAAAALAGCSSSPEPTRVVHYSNNWGAGDGLGGGTFTPAVRTALRDRNSSDTTAIASVPASSPELGD